MSQWYWLLPGALTGLANLLLLRATVRRIAPTGARRSALIIVALSALRLALAAGLLLVAVQQGVSALLYAFAGFWLVRWPLLIRYARRSHG